MTLISKIRKQKAVWWERDGHGADGMPLFKDAEEIDCRWEHSTSEVLTSDGEEVNVTSHVYVDRAMTVGDMLWLGTIEEFANLYDEPKIPPDDAGRIVKVEDTDKINRNETLHEAWL